MAKNLGDLEESFGDPDFVNAIWDAIGEVIKDDDHSRGYQKVLELISDKYNHGKNRNR